MTDRFRYTDAEWTAVAAQLTRHGAPTTEDRSYLEDAARDYRWFYDRTHPGSEEVKRAKASFQDIEKHSSGLLRAFDQLDKLPTKPSRLTSLQIAMARDPSKARAEYVKWRQQLAEIGISAKLLARGFPKSMKSGSNRARSDVQSDYFRKLLIFWEKHGGHAGKSPGSPAVKFILSAAKPEIPDLKASTVSHFIRDEIDVARPRRALQLATRK